MNNNHENYEYNEITPIGVTDWRNIRKPFGIKDQDRLGHIYIIGKTGVGKSTLIQNMAIPDIQKGKGMALIDPHGDLAENLLNYIPEDRIEDVIYFNPGDTEYPIAFNVLKGVHPDYHHLVASGLISTFKKIWAESWGPRLEYILRFSLHTLFEYPDATLLDIQPLLTDKAFREQVVSRMKNPHIVAFWRNEFDKYSPTMRAEAISPILNKIGLFFTSLPLRNIIGQKTRSFRMQQVMDEGKILIVNLSKGKIGEDASALLGSMLVTSIQLAALHRAGIEEHKRKPFFLYVDEFHSFVSLSFADILAEARKYKLSLCIANQYIDQLHEKIRTALFGNAGTIISFRVGAEDAKYLTQEFTPTFDESDFVGLQRYSMYIKLMIDGATSKGFSAVTESIQEQTNSHKRRVVESSRKKYGKGREEVEKNIYDRDRFQRIEGHNQQSFFT